MQARKCASEKSTLAFKPREDVTRSPKQGYQWPHKKDSFPTKIFFKKKKKREEKYFQFEEAIARHFNLEKRTLVSNESVVDS